MLKIERKFQGTQSDWEMWIRMFVPFWTSAVPCLCPRLLPVVWFLQPHTAAWSLVLDKTLGWAVTFSSSDLLQLLAVGLILHNF